MKEAAGERDTEVGPAESTPDLLSTAPNTEWLGAEAELDLSDPELDWNALEKGIVATTARHTQFKEANKDDWAKDGSADLAIDNVAVNSDMGKSRTPPEGTAKTVKRSTAGDGRLMVARPGCGGPRANTNRTTRRLEMKKEFSNHPINDWIKANQPLSSPTLQQKALAGPARGQAPAKARGAENDGQPAKTQKGGPTRAAFKSTAHPTKHARWSTSGKSAGTKTTGDSSTRVSNEGNTCYISAVLFYLFATTSSRDRWLDNISRESTEATRNKLRSKIWNDFVAPIRAGMGSTEAHHIGSDAMRRI